MTVRLVDQPASFMELMEEIAGAPLVALDTEAASFHRYIDRIYLIQLSTPEITAVIDPLSVGDLTPIGALLGDRTVQKVFHDADYDLRLFDKEFGFHARNLFDTRIAAQFLNEPGIGLGALLAKYFDIQADKRFQRADWSARPLSDGMLDYAAGDTDDLCELRDILRDQLAEKGRLTWVEEEFDRLEGTRWTAADPDPTVDFINMKGARVLDRRGLAILRELYVWRRKMALELDRAEFRVMGNEVLLHLAANPVTMADELIRVKGIGREGAERRAPELLAGIARGVAVPEDELPRFPRSPRRVPDPDYELRVEALKPIRNALAARLELAPGVLCPNGTLEAIARTLPQTLDELAMIDQIRRWQVQAIGTELLKALHAVVAAAPKEM